MSQDDIKYLGWFALCAVPTPGGVWMAFLFVAVCDVVRPSLTLRACLDLVPLSEFG